MKNKTCLLFIVVLIHYGFLLISCKGYFGEYKFFIQIDSSVSLKKEVKVILNGKNIGELKKVTLIGNKKILNLSIKNNIKIPSNSKVNYFENIFDLGYIDFTYPQEIESNSYLQRNDTLNADFTKKVKRRDLKLDSMIKESKLDSVLKEILLD